jgi:transcriptional regulator with XRE-family HTH domain
MKIDKYELAKKLGISHQAVYKWFGGKCQPSVKNLIKISKVLGISTDKVLEIISK